LIIASDLLAYPPLNCAADCSSRNYARSTFTFLIRFSRLLDKREQGNVKGLTLTISPQNAAVIMAVLALFVQTTVSRFIIHQYRARSASADRFYQQQQALLRNSATDLSFLWQSLRLGWAWRGFTKKPLLGSSPFIAMGDIPLRAFHFRWYLCIESHRRRGTGPFKKSFLWQSQLYICATYRQPCHC
jgi:hypothetical protein